MKVLLVLTTALMAMCLVGNCQYHYVPAQILIPSINYSSLNNNGFHYFTNNTFNNRTGWNNPTLNRTWTNPNSNVTNIHGDLIWGNIGYLDRLLFNQFYFKADRWWSGREKIIEYPKDLPGGYGRHETISSVRIYNKYYGDVNATQTEIINGGVGRRTVKILLRSNRGHPLKYQVQIYGH